MKYEKISYKLAKVQSRKRDLKRTHKSFAKTSMMNCLKKPSKIFKSIDRQASKSVEKKNIKLISKSSHGSAIGADEAI